MSRGRPKSKGKNKLKTVLLVLVIILIGLIAFIVRDIVVTREGGDPILNILPPFLDPGAGSTPGLTPGSTPDPDRNLDGISPLSGLPMDERFIRNRPLAVVINCMPEALPANGISEADILYEYPVEGGWTRMLAIFQDASQVELIGSIRSARHYTVQIAESHDAILVCAGRSPQAQTEMASLGIPVLNEVEGPHRDIFFRDRNRVPGNRVSLLHSVVISGERIREFLPGYGFRLEHTSDYKHSLNFVENVNMQRGENATEVAVRFSGAKTTTFFYDTAAGGYHVRQSNTDFVDANNNSRPVFTNVLVLRTSVSDIPGDTSGRVNVETTGRGTGHFVNGGKVIEISWIRTDLSSPFVYTLLDGTALDFGIGRTYICIVPTNARVDFG
ncbi:MAG: DUF3048 domain-containing protein [Oscillospiraceae bacterium]|nr:DUF3048 domain-containing protein [Oscillospiraceae bacterium]